MISLKSKKRARLWSMKYDLVMMGGIMLVLSTVMIDVSFFDIWYDYTRRHEDWELDEVFCIIIAGLFSGTILSIRQNMRLVQMFDCLIEAEKKIRAHEKEKFKREKLAALGQLSGGLAHEINNALQPVLGLSELIKIKSLDIDATIYEQADMINQNAFYMRDIVSKIMLVAREGSGESEVHYVTGLLKDVFDFTINLMPKTMVYKIDWRGDSKQTLIGQEIQVSRTEMVQIVTNLLTNAGYAMNKQGEITIAVQDIILDESTAKQKDITPQRYVCIDIIDHGCGMDDEAIKHAFEPFFTTKPEGEGTGLGLSVCYGLVRKWGGTIIINSQKGQGTIVKIYIPVIPKQEKGGD